MRKVREVDVPCEDGRLENDRDIFRDDERRGAVSARHRDARTLPVLRWWQVFMRIR